MLGENTSYRRLLEKCHRQKRKKVNSLQFHCLHSKLFILLLTNSKLRCIACHPSPLTSRQPPSFLEKPLCCLSQPFFKTSHTSLTSTFPGCKSEGRGRVKGFAKLTNCLSQVQPWLLATKKLVWSVGHLRRTQSVPSLAHVQPASRLSLGGRKELPPSPFPRVRWVLGPGLQHLLPAPCLSGTSIEQSPSTPPTILHRRQDPPRQPYQIC